MMSKTCLKANDPNDPKDPKKQIIQTIQKKNLNDPNDLYLEAGWRVSGSRLKGVCKSRVEGVCM